MFENVALPLVVAGYRQKEIARRVRAALDQVGLLGRERAFPVTLSGGEQQRVGIARAIVTRPPLLLADEPTGNLDPELSREIMGLFERLHQVGVTLLIASHDLALIAALPPAQREAFLLKEEGGLSLDEIATVTDVSREAAKSRLRYAVARLRKGLVETG